MARYLAEDNLAHANEVAAPVRVKKTIYSKYIKRIFDIIISSFALVVTSPINLVIAIVTFFDVGKPILFKQKRIGLNGEEFQIIKFRNMTNATDDNGNLLSPRDRVTKWGKFVRKTSLDELLNFWSVLKGDMSIIGPRPLVRNYMPRYSERHKMRHAVRPGLECPNISNKNITGSRWQIQFENDIWYVENISFMTDVKMLLGLVKLAFSRKETKVRGNAINSSFMGYDTEGMAITHMDIPDKYIERMYEEYGQNITSDVL